MGSRFNDSPVMPERHNPSSASKTTAIQPALDMYNYHGQLGRSQLQLSHCLVIQDATKPQVWSANKVCNITASTTAEIATMMAELDAVFAGLPYRNFDLTPLTPPTCAAHLLLHDYHEQSVILQILLTGELNSSSDTPHPKLRPVNSDADWQALHQLVSIDHAEGARTAGALKEAVTHGIVAGYKATAPACQFFLAEVDGESCAYGSATVGPNRMGMVEDLFTLPTYRGRGLASSLIKHCVEYCRGSGATDILIGSHATEPPKHLYNRLGFKPRFLVRQVMKQL